jgi:zinc/manganese transport system substrate-binding protein
MTMKKIYGLLIPVALLALGAKTSEATLRLIATTPDLANITSQIGGEWVKVESLAKGTEDIHAVPQRPSFVPKLNQADGVVLIGLEAEHAFLPALLEVAQNPRIQRGQKGYIDCSEKITPIEVPTDLSRAQGELHAQGNPHYNTDPRQGAAIAAAITEGLSRLDPAHSDVFHKNQDAFKKALDAKIAEWKTLAGPLQGVKVVSYHPDMEYLAQFAGLKIINTVELKPGIPPTPKHLQEVVTQMKAENVSLIIHEIQYPADTANWIASQTGAKVAHVATMGGAFADSKTYFGMIDHNLHALVDAVKK